MGKKATFISRPHEPNLDLVDYMKYINPSGYDDIEDYVNAVIRNRREQALDRSRNRTLGAYVNLNGGKWRDSEDYGNWNCISTATDSYNDDNQAANRSESSIADRENMYNPIYYTRKRKDGTLAGSWSNSEFKANAEKMGFKPIPISEAQPGDILQYDVQPNVPYHAVIYDHKDDDGTYKVNYANGSYREVPKETYHKDAIFSSKDPARAFTYVGTPEERQYWINTWFANHKLQPQPAFEPIDYSKYIGGGIRDITL